MIEIKNKMMIKVLLICCVFLCSLSTLDNKRHGLIIGFASAKEKTKSSDGKSNKNEIQIVSLWENIKLIGTVCSTEKKTNLAIIENSNNNYQSIHYQGSEITNGAKIKSIFPDHVFLEKDGKKIMLKISGGSEFNQKELHSKGYQKILANEWAINPNKLFKDLGDIAKLCDDLEIEKTKNGFEITDIADNEFLKDLGLQEGDILKDINGREFDNLYDAVNYMWNMENDTRFDINIVRNEEEQTLVFHSHFDHLPSYVETGAVTPQKITGLLTVRHEYTITNIIYK
jgi:type II secretion system protein C